MVSSLALSLSEPAPAGGVLVSLNSSNDDVVAVTGSVFIAEGQSTAATNPQLTADQLGSATVFASADNYGPDERELTVTLTMNFTPANISVVETLTKTAFLNLSAPAPSGGLTVNLSSSESNIATVPASVLVPEGQLSAQVTVTAIAQGSAQITASPQAGVEASLGVTVTPAPAINANNLTTGKDLQSPANVYLGGTPTGPTIVTIEISDPAIAIVSTSATTVGSAVASISNIISTSVPQVYIQGLQQGETTYTVSAPGFAPVTRTVKVLPSGFGVQNQIGQYGDVSGNTIQTTTFSANTTFYVFPVIQNNGFWYSQWYLALRGGLDLQIEVESTNPNAGIITSSPVTLSGGSTQVTTQFAPVANGSTRVQVVTPTGYGAPDRYNGQHVEVSSPDININAPLLGKDLINSTSVYLDAAPPAPVDVQVCSSAGTILLLSKASTDNGSNCVTFENVSSTNVGSLYVHGINQGSAQLQASAAGYNNGNTTVEVWPSGFGFWYTNYSANVANGSNNDVLIGAYILYPATLNYYSSLPLRPSVEVDVNFTSSDPAVGEQSAPLSFVPGLQYLNASFNAKQAGEVTLTMQTPTGFSTPNNYRFATMQVNP